MNKILFYAMTGEKSCLMHVLMNAVDLAKKGNEVKIIFEGQSVKWPAKLQSEKNPHYVNAKTEGLIAGICLACSNQLDVLEENKALGLALISGLHGHAPMSPFIAEGYHIISI